MAKIIDLTNVLVSFLKNPRVEPLFIHLDIRNERFNHLNITLRQKLT